MLSIGSLHLTSPVILAPMAGVTNVAFRTLCRELEQHAQGTVSGLYICEMVTARALIERRAEALHMMTFSAEESPRSVQLYTVDPAITYQAAKMIADENMADHIDINFGCPVPKVTRHGGGAALPYKQKLFGRIIHEAVRAVSNTSIPITVKYRLGIDHKHLTYLHAGHIAQEEGASAITLHARTAAQRYSGQADWSKIGELKTSIRHIPVLGNGDIFEAHDAISMMHHTGCDGVVIGRGCLGRPWLFSELSAIFTGQPSPPPPTLGYVSMIIRRHSQLLIDHYGHQKAMRDIRKHISWYLHGFAVGSSLRSQLARVETYQELDVLLNQLNPDLVFPHTATGPRGRRGSPGRVILPEGWLDDPDDQTIPVRADLMNSGG